MVTRPIPPGSAEWTSTRGQQAIATEMREHQQRGAWDTTQVDELDALVKQSKEVEQDVISGGVHPILGAKQAEKGGDSVQ